MRNKKNMKLLRIYASSTDQFDGRLLYEYIVVRAREEGLAGATVHRGVMGFGASSTIHTSRFWELTEKLPVCIEIVDEEEKILAFFSHIEPILEKMPKGCLVLQHNVEMLLMKTGGQQPPVSCD